MTIAPEQIRAQVAAMTEDQVSELLPAMERDSPLVTFKLLGYEPLPKQWLVHRMAPWSEGGPWDVFFGGAAGPGKSLALFMEGVAWCHRVPGFEAWAVRKTYPQLQDSFIKWIMQYGYLKGIGMGPKYWNASRHELTFPNGSVFKFRHANDDKAAEDMLSADCQLLLVDERTTLLPSVVEKLSSRIRSAREGLPTVGIRSASNPGGIGHGDVKQKLIDPAPKGFTRLRTTLPSGASADRYFIPALPRDNPYLDQGYYDTLALLPPDMQASYLHGDWTRFEGMAFSEWSPELHVVEPEDWPIPIDAPHMVGVDYGLVHPFVALWGAKLSDSTIVIYRELCKTNLTPEAQAKMILEAERPGERPRPRSVPTFLDPSCWARQPHSPLPIGDSAPEGSVAWSYEQAGLPVHRANNDRLAGKALIHRGLRVQADGRPRLLIWSTCFNLIRTMPNLPRDPSRPEDVLKFDGDDSYDALRYLLMSITRRRAKSRSYGSAIANA